MNLPKMSGFELWQELTVKKVCPLSLPAIQDAERKNVSGAPTVVKKQEAKKVANPLCEKRSKNSGIRQDIQTKRDLIFFVKWPHYIQLQQQRTIL